MFGMRSKNPALAVIAFVGIGLIAFANGREDTEGGVVLNPNPPTVPASNMRWEMGNLPAPRSTEAAAPTRADGSFDDAARNDTAPAEPPLVEDPYAG